MGSCTAALFAQSLSLPYSKPVLFVGDHQCQPVITDLFLNQRMGANDNVRLMVFCHAAGFPLLFRCHGAGKQDGFLGQAAIGKQLYNGLVMLPGQNFRGDH